MKETAERILVVDDHAAARESIAVVLREAGLQVDACGGGSEAIRLFENKTYSCVVSDLQMPGMNGIELMQRVHGTNPVVPFLLVTAHASVATAVEAMRLGAFDYIEKPFEIQRLERLVFEGIRHFRSRRRETASGNVEKKETAESVGLMGSAGSAESGEKTLLIGSSHVMRELRRRIETVAKVGETVLICGENGTGKERVARLIHESGPRRDAPWITLNCPALSPQLMESELFGHKKGAFTGADCDRIGRFEAASNGTLLLDEISEIDLNLQSKLLRVLQEHSFERVGSSETISSRARVLATTNRDLETEIKKGRFREDLYYRLAVLPISVPPLRERKEDIPELLDAFSLRASRRLGRPRLRFDADATQLLLKYDWPGNVRQLENIVTRASVLGESDSVSADDLRRWLGIESDASFFPAKTTFSNSEPHEIRTATPTSIPVQTPTSIPVQTPTSTFIPTSTSTPSPISTSASTPAEKQTNPQTHTHPQTQASPQTHTTDAGPFLREDSGRLNANRPFSIGMSLEEVEREMIEATLEHFKGHREKTAKTLGIGVRTLQGKLRQYGYAPREKRKTVLEN